MASGENGKREKKNVEEKRIVIRRSGGKARSLNLLGPYLQHFPGKFVVFSNFFHFPAIFSHPGSDIRTIIFMHDGHMIAYCEAISISYQVNFVEALGTGILFR